MNEAHALVFGRRIIGAVVFFHVVVDAFGGQFGVQFAVVAILVLAFEVVDAVGHVGCLLNLGQETSRANAVNAAGRQEEAVAFFHRVVGNGIENGIVLHHLLVLFGRDFFLQSAPQVCVFVAVHDVPHLCFAAALPLFLGNLVRGMYLDGKILAGINELDEQGKLVTKALIVGFSNEFAFQFAHNVVQGAALILAFTDDSLVVFHA